MPNVYGVIPDASGEPASGTVVFRPTAYRGADDGDSLLGRSPIRLTLDEDGEFDVDLDSGNYNIDIRLKGAPTFTREITIPDTAGSVNIKAVLEDYLEVE